MSEFVWNLNTNHKLIIRILITFLIGLFIITYINYDGVESDLKNAKKLNFNGIIIKKFRKKNNHNNPTIKLNTYKETTVFTNHMWNLIEVGDSLYKKKGELHTEVYRNNQLIHVDSVLDSEGHFFSYKSKIEPN